MFEITKCSNEWNATVEALSQGKQIILIRKYNTNLKGFLLYSTTGYTLKDDYLGSLQIKNLLKTMRCLKKKITK